jgi:hypothetical protein
MGKGVMLWSKLYADLPENPKSIRLGALIDEHNAHVYPLNVWCWATRQAPDGVIRSTAAAALPRMVEEAARWRGKPGVLFKAMLETGWLDALERPVRRVLIHDWDAINGSHTRAAEKGAERVRRFRARQKSAKFSAESAETEVPEFAGPQGDVTVTEPVTSALRNADVTEERVYKLPMRAALQPPRPALATGAIKKPLVVAGRRKRKSTKSSFQTTTTNGQCVRNEDLARDLLRELQAGLEGKGKRYVAEQLGTQYFALRLDGATLELGCKDEYAVGYFSENVELLALEALRDVDPAMNIRVLVAERPKAPTPPTDWRLDECLLWLERSGLSMKPRPTDANLAQFWDEAERVPPADLLHAARLFRADAFWAKDNWAVFRFICDGVWKIRLPGRQHVEPAQASR